MAQAFLRAMGSSCGDPERRSIFQIRVQTVNHSFEYTSVLFLPSGPFMIGICQEETGGLRQAFMPAKNFTGERNPSDCRVSTTATQWGPAIHSQYRAAGQAPDRQSLKFEFGETC